MPIGILTDAINGAPFPRRLSHHFSGGPNHRGDPEAENKKAGALSCFGAEVAKEGVHSLPYLLSGRQSECSGAWSFFYCGVVNLSKIDRVLFETRQDRKSFACSPCHGMSWHAITRRH